MRKKPRTKKEPLHLDKVDRASVSSPNRNNMFLQRWTGEGGGGVTNLGGLCVMWSHRAGRGMHLLGASRLQTEQGLEVKRYPAQTGVCMPAGRRKGDPLSQPPHSHPGHGMACVTEIQTNPRLPDNPQPTTCVGDEEKLGLENELKHTLQQRLMYLSGMVWWGGAWWCPCHVTPRLPSCVVGSYMTPVSTVTGRFTGLLVPPSSLCH